MFRPDGLFLLISRLIALRVWLTVATAPPCACVPKIHRVLNRLLGRVGLPRGPCGGGPMPSGGGGCQNRVGRRGGGPGGRPSRPLVHPAHPVPAETAEAHPRIARIEFVSPVLPKAAIAAATIPLRGPFAPRPPTPHTADVRKSSSRRPTCDRIYICSSRSLHLRRRQPQQVFALIVRQLVRKKLFEVLPPHARTHCLIHPAHQLPTRCPGP